ncbi:MAG: hypothetical protein KF758_16975 [Anaerolineales bacterium]|nr:hypothetical protein [Anaerolineales bacterium]
MEGFRYTLVLKEPVLANSLSGEPNSANSLYYIPGGLLRGAAINAYAGNKDAADSAFRRLFLDGTTRYMNAYPLSGKQKNTFPTPRKFKKHKYSDASDFSTIESNSIVALEEEWQINVHTQRDAKLGHATTNAGAVYRYISLPAGLHLEGAVFTKTKTDAELLGSLLNGKTILLGKARTAGYGSVTVKTEPLGEMYPFINNISAQNKTFTITLLSPAIVRNEFGQPTLDPTVALKSRLAVENLTIVKSYQTDEVVGGFNRKWGLPLPQVTAISAGSVFEVNANVDDAKLSDLAKSGLGERRAEGFGWIAVNLLIPESVKDEDWSTQRPMIDTLNNNVNNSLGQNHTANLMLKRLASREFDEAVIHAAREMTRDYKGSIPNSQLSRWRVIVRDLLDKRNDKGGFKLTRLLKFIENSKGKTGWQKMEKARVKIQNETPRLTEWLDEFLKQPDKLFQVLPIKADYKKSLGENEYKITDEINIEYRLRLIDAVLAIMMKKNGGNNEQK